MSDETNNTIDLDDPSFKEVTDYDPTQDIDARVTPPELDSQGNVIDYLIKLSVGKNPKGSTEPYGSSDKNGKKFIALKIQAQVVAPDKSYDKSFVNFPFGGVNTKVYNGTTSAANLCRLLGKTMPTKLTQVDQIAYVVSLLEDKPTLPGRIFWDSYCSNCEETVVTGEKSFPEKEGGGHKDVVDCPKCHQEVRANAKIAKFSVLKG